LEGENPRISQKIRYPGFNVHNHNLLTIDERGEGESGGGEIKRYRGLEPLNIVGLKELDSNQQL
jgi:hypothetical protein